MLQEQPLHARSTRSRASSRPLFSSLQACLHALPAPPRADARCQARPPPRACRMAAGYAHLRVRALVVHDADRRGKVNHLAGGQVEYVGRRRLEPAHARARVPAAHPRVHKQHPDHQGSPCPSALLTSQPAGLRPRLLNRHVRSCLPASSRSRVPLNAPERALTRRSRRQTLAAGVRRAAGRSARPAAGPSRWAATRPSCTRGTGSCLHVGTCTTPRSTPQHIHGSAPELAAACGERGEASVCVERACVRGGGGRRVGAPLHPVVLQHDLPRRAVQQRVHKHLQQA